MKIKIILLILFCLIGFLCSQWAKNLDVKNQITKIECKGGVCSPPE